MTTSLETRIEDLRAHLTNAARTDTTSRVVVSPYRICPIGAHVDHQGGPVLGAAIDAETLLVFVPTHTDRCHLESKNFDAPYDVALESLREGGDPPEGWGRYFWAAAATLLPHVRGTPRGIDARVAGSLPGSGLSSSASVVLSYLKALAHVNEIELTPEEMVTLARRAENEHVGVKCGILDPACIVASRRDHLVSIDTVVPTFNPVAGSGPARESVFLVAFSGVDRNLRQTGFNDRVEQCHEAARELGKISGQPGAEKLGDLDEDAFVRHLEDLPSTLQKRARHFFEERRRVEAGIDAWKSGDLEGFGRLMNDSCRSSIENFEVGSPEIVDLYSLIRETPGIYGARFSGAGFGGCVVALAQATRGTECVERIERAYRKRAPHLTNAFVFLAHTRDGLHLR